MPVRPPNEPAATSDLHFDLDRVRLEAARALPAECFDDFQRLAKTLIHGPPFQWLLVEAPDQRLRSQVLDALDTVLLVAHLKTSRLVVDASTADVVELEQKLVSHAEQAPVVQVLVASDWFDEAGRRWDALNARRERIAHAAKARLVFWLNKEGIERAARFAPDLWAWRGGIYTFKVEVRSMPGAALERLAPRPTGLDTRSMAERHRRIAEIRAWLANNPASPDELLAPILDELGKLLHSVGDYDAALAHWRNQELPLYERLGAERSRAITMGQIADIYQARGELDEALRIRRDEELPVFEHLGELRERAATMSRIADILQVRGELDEALRIHRQEVLPDFERLGDVHSRAVTMGKIADILQARGEPDDALHIRREEELPVYERLGDVRSRAITIGKIADILEARGELDEALRIHREEVLPVFKRLGDVRKRAVTMGKIADILEARGELDEALRIYRDEQLPVYERLGDARELLVARANLALTLLARAAVGDREEAEKVLQLALIDAERLHLPEAERIRGILKRARLQDG